MKTKKPVSVVLDQLAILSLLAIAGVSCSQKEAGAQAADARPPSAAEKAADELLLGAWNLSNPLVPDTRYLFTNSSGRRTVTVQEGGRTVASHDFEVLTEATIQITGSTNGPRKGLEFTEKEMKDIIQLKRPPKQLRFSKTAPPPFNARQRASTVFAFGIFEGIPVPMDKIAPQSPLAASSSNYLDAFVEKKPTFYPANWSFKEGRTFLASRSDLPTDKAKARLPRVQGLQSRYGISPMIWCEATNEVTGIILYAGGDQSYTHMGLTPKKFPASPFDSEEEEPMASVMQQSFHGSLNNAGWPLTVCIQYRDGEEWVGTFVLRK